MNRKAGYSFHDREKEVGGGFVDVSSSLYGTRGLHPRQVDRSRAALYSFVPLSTYINAILNCTILNYNLMSKIKKSIISFVS